MFTAVQIRSRPRRGRSAVRSVFGVRSCSKRLTAVRVRSRPRRSAVRVSAGRSFDPVHGRSDNARFRHARPYSAHIPRRSRPFVCVRSCSRSTIGRGDPATIERPRIGRSSFDPVRGRSAMFTAVQITRSFAVYGRVRRSPGRVHGSSATFTPVQSLPNCGRVLAKVVCSATFTLVQRCSRPNGRGRLLFAAAIVRRSQNTYRPVVGEVGAWSCLFSDVHDRSATFTNRRDSRGSAALGALSADVRGRSVTFAHVRRCSYRRALANKAGSVR